MKTKKAPHVSKRAEGTAAAAPAPRKRFGGPSGTPGKHLQAQRLLRAPAKFFALIDKAIEHNADSDQVGGYSGFSDWARHHLAIAAADELGIDPLEVLQMIKS